MSRVYDETKFLVQHETCDHTLSECALNECVYNSKQNFKSKHYFIGNYILINFSCHFYY